MTVSGCTVQRPQAAGLTLVELLAVLVLLTLTFSVAGVRLAATSTHAQLHSAASRLHDLDAHARLVARSGEPASLLLDDRGRVARVQATGSAELLASMALPREVSVEIRSSSGEAAIGFDRLGRSQDYRVVMQAGESTLGWQVYGLTGYVPGFGPGDDP